MIRACISFELSTIVWNYLHPAPATRAAPLLDPAEFDACRVQAKRELFDIIKRHSKETKGELKKLRNTLGARLGMLNDPYKNAEPTRIRKAINEMQLPVFSGSQSAELQFRLWSDTRNSLMHEGGYREAYEGGYREASGKEQVERHYILRQMSALALYRLIGYTGQITFTARNGDADYVL